MGVSTEANAASVLVVYYYLAGCLHYVLANDHPSYSQESSVRKLQATCAQNTAQESRSKSQMPKDDSE